MCSAPKPSFINRILNQIPNKNLKKKIRDLRREQNDYFVLNQIESYKPDWLYSRNCGVLSPETMTSIKDKFNVKTITTVADSPFNNNRSTFAVSLRYYDYVLTCEDTWIKFIRNVSPNSKIIKWYGGYDPERFYPPDRKSISEQDREKLSLEVVFTGGSYSEKPEGIYRSSILGQLAEDGYNVSLYGDEGWKYWFQYYPKLAECFNGSRLNYQDYIKLLNLSKIYINMPSPQIPTGFQPRVFEIAACKGFQLIDHSDDLLSIFQEDKIATFKDYPDLKAKIDYYLEHPEERDRIANYMYDIVKDDFTWKKQVKIIAEKIGML